MMIMYHYLAMVWVLSVTRRNSVGQGVMGGFGCSLLQMLTITRFVSSCQLIKDRLGCFAFLNYLCFDDVLLASFKLIQQGSDWGGIKCCLLGWHEVMVGIKCVMCVTMYLCAYVQQFGICSCTC